MGEAFLVVSPALLAIDLLSRRRDLGTLHTGSHNSSVIVAVPPEVWDMVRARLLRPALAGGRLAVLERVHCRACVREALWNELAEPEGVGFEWLGCDPDMYFDKLSRAIEQDRWAYQEAHVWDADWTDHAQPGECHHPASDCLGGFLSNRQP